METFKEITFGTLKIIVYHDKHGIIHRGENSVKPALYMINTETDKIMRKEYYCFNEFVFGMHFGEDGRIRNYVDEPKCTYHRYQNCIDHVLCNV